MFGRRIRLASRNSSRGGPFRFVAGLTVVALVAALCALVQSAPAQAAPPPTADQDVTDIWNGLDALQSFSRGLATDGAFGTPLADLGLAPGSADGLGFDNLLQKLLIDRLSSSVLTLGELVNALKGTSISLGDGREASVTLTSASSNGVESLQFGIDVTKQVASAPLALKTTGPTFDFSAPVQVDLAFHASFTVDYDTAARAVYVDTGAAAPSLTLSAHAHFPCVSGSPPCAQDVSAVHAGIGVLGIKLGAGSSFDLTTNLTATLRDPNGDGRVYLGTFAGGGFQEFAEPSGAGSTPGELAGGAAAAAGMATVGFGATPGAMTAHLILEPDGSFPLPGVNATVDVAWPDITTGSPSASVSSGALDTVQAFENLSPSDLAQGLAQLGTALEGIQMSRSYKDATDAKTGTISPMAAGDVTATYTATGGTSAPEAGDLFRIGSGVGAPVREVEQFKSGTITFGSPVNAAANGPVTQVDAQGNIDLPFMKGTLADVFQANEAITDFLSKHVTQNYNAVPNARTGTLSASAGNQATYTAVDGGSPQSGDYYRMGSATRKVTAVSGAGPYTVIFDGPAVDGSATQVALGDIVPDFSSLQDMLDDLVNHAGLPAGLSFTVGNVGYDASTSKLSIELGIGRAGGTPIGLDPFQKIADGTATAVGTDSATGNPTLTDTNSTWQANGFAGHVVKVGNATNIVKGNDAHTLTLSGPWHGTAPAVGDAYQIGGQDSQIGAISFANKLDELSAHSGILNANAQIPLATVDPSYQAAVTLVLDLQSPKTGAGCVGLLFNGEVNNQACPFNADNKDGTKTLVAQLPTAADRVLLRTQGSGGHGLHLLTADAPIDSQVDVNATVGFLGLKLSGALHECAAFQGSTTDCDTSAHLLSVDFKDGLGDAQGDVPLSKIFSTLASDPTSLATINVHGAVKATITPHITGIPGFDEATFFGGSTPDFALSMTDITDPSTINFDTSGFTGALDKIKAFNFDTSNPKALFGEILQTLKTLSKLLKTAGANSGNSAIDSALNTKIPVVGIKLGDVFSASEQGQGANVSYTDTTLKDTDQDFSKEDLLLRTVVAGTSTGVITNATGDTITVGSWQGGQPAPGAQYQVENALDSAIDLLTANPADNLQQLIALVNNRLGALGVPIAISVDTSATPATLGFQLDWKRDFDFSTPLAFDFNLGSGDNSIIGTQASGLAHLDAVAEAKVKLLLPLDVGGESGATGPSGLQVDPTGTSLSASISGGASGFVKANLGPMNLSLGDPSGVGQAADAQATFSADLGSTDTAPESISDFLSSVGVQFNQGATGVKCGTDTSTDLALCASLPLYLSTDGGQTYAPVNDGTTSDPDVLALRLPLSGSLSDEFQLTDSGGTVLDVSGSDTRKRLEVPKDLLDDLAKSVLDFSQLGQGLDGYFKFAEQSLNLASFGGKLPLVGSDLQQGAQFLETVQGYVDSTLGDLASVGSEDALKTWINDKLDTALKPVLPGNSKVNFDFVCSATLDTPTGVAGTPDTVGTDDFKYRVAATTSNGTKESKASAVADVSNAKLSGNDAINLSWTKVEAADGYVVYRSKDNGSSWEKFVITTNTASFKDVDDTGAAGNPDTVTSNPTLDPCPIADTTGVTLTADIGQGTVNAADGCVKGSGCIGDDGSLSVPLNIGVPGLSLSAATKDGKPDPDQNLAVRVGWRIHLKIGLDLHRGFFIETQDQTDPEIALGVAVSLPKAIQANISFLKINLCDFDNTQTYGPGQSCPFTPLVPADKPRTAGDPKPLFAGMFGIDLHTPDATKTAFSDPAFTANDAPANDITLSDLTNFADLKKLVTVGLSAKVHIDWDFQALVDSSLPGVGGEFKLDWQWGAQLNKPTVATDTGSDATPPVESGHAPDIEFDNVYLSAGGFLSGVLGPIVKEVQQFTSPLKPVIDTLYAPIPVLSDLSHLVGGGDVTLISIAEAFSTLAGGPDLTMVERILQVIKLINEIPTGDDGLGIFIGSFKLSSSKAIDTSATPDNTNSLIDPNSIEPGDNGGKSVSDAMSDASKKNGTSAIATSKSKAGFSFPILDNPSSVFNLLMGGDVDLIRFDSGNLTLGFSYSQQFGPVYAPPPVMITISGSASVSARIIAGFDTYGLRKAYEAIKNGGSAGTIAGGILDSLFLYTTDPTKDDGKPVPVLTLQGELAAGASVSVLIVSVGIEGGISLTINFYWNDPDNDGKFRTSEFLGTALKNPLCLFNVDGKLSVFLRLFVTIGFGPFSATFSFTLVNITLLDFSVHPDCTPPPPELGEVQGSVLYLFFGHLGGSAQRGDPWGNSGEDESIKVHELHDNTSGAFSGFSVDGLNRHEEFIDNAIDTVVLDARGYAGKENLVISGDSNESQSVADGPPTPRPFDKTAIVYGSDNDDTVKIDGGIAYVDGRGGNDTINLSGSGNDYVAGGPGNDNVTVGNGADWLAGDSALPFSTLTLNNHRQVGDPAPHGSWSDIDAVDPTSVGKPGKGEANDDGGDSILAGYGVNHIFGNGGDDTVSVATDKPLTSGETRTPGTNAASDDTIVGGTGNNNIHSGSGNDTIYAGQEWGATSDKPNYDGEPGDGSNRVDTGTGSDTVHGGSGSDFVVGHSVHGGADTVYGGSGSDILVGGDGADHIYGGAGQDYLSGGPAKVDQFTPSDPVLGDWKITPTPDGHQVDGKLLVGGDNADHIYGANGGDEVYGDRQEDKCVLPSSGPRSTPPAETGSGSPGGDYIVGGNGDNSISGGSGNDTLYAGTGNDVLCGAAGNDKMYGGAGKDTMFGGSNDDLLVAGTGNSALYGNDGQDTVIAGKGNDWVEGNDGHDVIDGGTGQSVLIGGTSTALRHDDGDTIYGGTGNNVIIGDNGTVDVNLAWPGSGKPFAEPVVVHVYDLETNSPTSYGGNDVISGGSGNVQVYAGLGDDYVVGGTGVDHLEGNPGCDTIYGGSQDDDILGGTSPLAVAGGSVDGIPDGCDGHGTDVTPATLSAYHPVIGNTIYGYLPFGANPTHHNVIVGGNGSITRTGATDQNDGAAVRTVQQLALLTIGGQDTIYGGPGDDSIFGGLGDDSINTGNANNYVEGGPGDDAILGGTGSNDILGGTSPLALPTAGVDALTTAAVPDGADTIHADGRTTSPPAGAAQDGADVVLADNGCISRGVGAAATDANGCPTGPASAPPKWQFSAADPETKTNEHPNGALVRPVIRQLDVTDCPDGTCTPDVQGGNDHVWGGTSDDLLFGETGNDAVYGGPPDTNGIGGTAGSPAGNDYLEGGAGSDTMAGGAGDDDLIGGTAPTYLPGKNTALVSDGTAGGNGITLPAPANAKLSVPGSGVRGNTMDGGDGGDVLLGGNGEITHPTSLGQWQVNANDQAFVRTAVDLQLLTIGGDDIMRGGPGADRMFGGLANDDMAGGNGDDYVEGGPDRDVVQGGAGSDDLVGGTSPVALPAPPTGTNDPVAAGTPDGDVTQGVRQGNIICGFLCGQSTSAVDDDVTVANNGRIDRCPAANGKPAGSDGCTWATTSYGNEKEASKPGVAQSGKITSTSLGTPITRYVTLLGQDHAESTHNGNDYVEGDGGNNLIWGEDGSDNVHAGTPNPNSPNLDECLANSDPNDGQNIVIGGYGNDVLCGGGGDDALLGNRGLVTVVPFVNGTGNNAAVTIGQNGGAPYGTFTYPHSGNTIYRVDLSQESVNGVLTPVPDWNHNAATGQDQQHDVVFGGQGNDTIHGSPGADFLEGDDGMHLHGGPAATGGDDIVFGGQGNDSMQGGPGNDHLYGGAGNDDADVIREDADIAFKTNDSRSCLPMLFPTINTDPTTILTTDGCPTGGFGSQSYASRFPLPAASSYDTDPGGLDNGGTTKNSTLFGDIMYGGFNRDVMQSQNTALGDRMIDDFGAFNLEVACPGAYGGYQINRALSPTLRTFLQQLSLADGAVTTSTEASSGGVELSLIYAGESGVNTGPDYPTTPGHFTC